ncbi:MAG: hypothetical protein RMK74_06550 [Myxococcales bacterium]|nr:hypothetical protein [Myxococcales bacterium]
MDSELREAIDRLGRRVDEAAEAARAACEEARAAREEARAAREEVRAVARAAERFGASLDHVVEELRGMGRNIAHLAGALADTARSHAELTDRVNRTFENHVRGATEQLERWQDLDKRLTRLERIVESLQPRAVDPGV